MEGDRELILQAVSGDPRAWGALVERYKRLVYSIPRRYSIPEEACDDVFQDVFTLLLRNLSRLRDSDSIIKWLMVTTHRECWRWSRREQRQKRDSQPERAAGPQAEEPAEEQMLRWEREQLVRQGLEELGGRCKKLLEALFFAQNPQGYDQTARALGMPVGSIGPTRNRCLAKLAEILKGTTLD